MNSEKRMPPPTSAARWRKVENESGFPFYINDSGSGKQWDHPKYVTIKQRLDDCNYIIYASYRVASKFRVLQDALYMNEIPLAIISGVFEKHRLGATENTLCLESYDLEAVLFDIFFAANKHNHTNNDVDLASELMMNFLYNIYDKDRKANIEVSSVKITLALLSGCSLNSLHRFIFSLCSDHNNCVTRLRLQSLLTRISGIILYLNENASFGHHLIRTSMEQCFIKNPGLVGINESTFIAWLHGNPQIFSWLPIMHRLKMSETVLHQVKCSACKLTPIMGLRYRCIKCIKYTQCQRCFFTGRTSHSHKLSHTMKEHCRESSTIGVSQAIARKFSSFIKCKYRVNQNCLADVTIVDTKPVGGENKELYFKPSENEVTSQVQPLSSPLSQLQVIIKQLEMQNGELHRLLLLGSRSDKDMKVYLEEHRMHVETQIDKLKTLKNFMNVPECIPIPTPLPHTLESTPLVCNGKTLSRGLKGIDLFSPITQTPEVSITDHTQLPVFRLDNTPKDVDVTRDSFVTPYSLRDITTWIGGAPSNNPEYSVDDKLFDDPPAQTDLDDALAKLQQILANNFSLDESLGNVDNRQLKSAVNEVEGMLSTIIDNVESNKVTPLQVTSVPYYGTTS